MKKSGLPQKTWEWHELMATVLLTVSHQVKWLLSVLHKHPSGYRYSGTGAAQGSHPMPGPRAWLPKARRGWARAQVPTQAARAISSLHPTPRAGGCRGFFPGHTLTHSFMPVCLFLHPLPASEVWFLLPPNLFFSPQSDSNSWCIYLGWCGCCKMRYLQQPVCGWFERRRVSTMSLKEGVRYKSCLQTARVHSRLQRHLFVWKVGWVFLPPFFFFLDLEEDESDGVCAFV